MCTSLAKLNISILCWNIFQDKGKSTQIIRNKTSVTMINHVKLLPQPHKSCSKTLRKCQNDRLAAGLCSKKKNEQARNHIAANEWFTAVFDLTAMGAARPDTISNPDRFESGALYTESLIVYLGLYYFPRESFWLRIWEQTQIGKVSFPHNKSYTFCDIALEYTNSPSHNSTQMFDNTHLLIINFSSEFTAVTVTD